MVEWVTGTGVIRAAGRSGSVTVGTTDWKRATAVVQLPYPVDAALAGRAGALRFPTSDVRVDDGTGPRPPAADERLPGSRYQLSAGGSLETLVRFEGPATLERDGEGVTLSFPGPTPVSVGFRDDVPEPRTVTVPRTPAGVAAAVTAAGEPLADAGPGRSRPSRRPHPPLLEFEDGGPADEDAAGRRSRRGTPGGDRAFVFRVPADLEHVLVAAPLAYYFGAELVADGDGAPLLSAPSIGFERAYGALPAFATEVAADFRRAFHLDCLARDSPYDGDLDRSPLGSIGLETAAVRRVSPVVRYATFLDAPTGSVDLPEWHLSTYVDASYEHALSLPYLLDRLSLVYPAEASEMEPRDLLECSLDDFYRGEVVSVRPIDPELGVGRSHAWLAEGKPVDAFKTSTAAHRHRLAALDRDRDEIRIDVVVNDAEMRGELSIAEIYRDRTSGPPVSLHVHEALTTAELAATFERRTDFVHYVGHCEVDGLRCPDGYLSATSLDASRATTFFLNACGSYREGRTLVEKGSVAGGVTLDSVLNEQATRVGTAFGRLLVAGFGIDRALSLARRRIMMGKDYAVVGDGTYALAPSCGHPAVVAVDPDGDDFAVRYEVGSTRAAGATFRDPLSGTDRLYGTATSATRDEEALTAFLDGRSLPVVYDGDLAWSDELAAEMDRSGGLREP